MGHSRLIHSAPVTTNVRYASNSYRIIAAQRMTLSANKRQSTATNSSNRKTASRRSLRNPIRCFDQAALSPHSPQMVRSTLHQGVSSGLANKSVLIAGAAAAANGTNELAVQNQREPARRSDQGRIECRDVGMP